MDKTNGINYENEMTRLKYFVENKKLKRKIFIVAMSDAS